MSLIALVFIALIGSSWSFVIQPKAGCQISVNTDLPTPQPLLLVQNATEETGEFIYPSQGDNIILNTGDKIMLACPGNGNYLEGVSLSVVIATCESGKTFQLDQAGKFQFTNLRCVHTPFHTARKTGKTCSDKTEIEIGFDTAARFVRTLLVCFDEAKYDTLWSHFKLTRSIGGYESGYPRPDFVSGEFYQGLGLPPSELYKRDHEITALTRILGSATLAKKYIHSSDDYFMSRGHMTAKADFVFGALQRSTFWYLNVAPQWQTFNGANWNQLEMDVRSFADSKKLDLDVYTGVYGVATLPDVDNVEQELYLYVDDNNNKAITVPKFYWKVIYDPKTKKGTAFVGLNNPHKDLVPEEDLLCTDICDKISWLKWKPNDKVKGFSYCCDVNDLAKTVEYLPKLDVVETLT